MVLAVSKILIRNLLDGKSVKLQRHCVSCSYQLDFPFKTGLKQIRKRWDNITPARRKLHILAITTLEEVRQLKMSAIPVINVAKIGLASRNPSAKDLNGKNAFVGIMVVWTHPGGQDWILSICYFPDEMKLYPHMQKLAKNSTQRYPKSASWA